MFSMIRKEALVLAVACLALAISAARADVPGTLAIQVQLTPEHRDTGGGSDRVVNLRATILNDASVPLYMEAHCGVLSVGRDGAFGLTLGTSVPVALPFDEQYYVLIEACYERDGCDGITDIAACRPGDRVDAIVPLDPVAYAHRAREADNLAPSFLFSGDVAGPFFDLQLEPGVVGTPEIEDGSVTIPKLSFDPATQAELNAEATTRAAADTTLQSNITTEATTRAAADTAETTARTAADTAEATARAAADTHSGDVAGPFGNLQIQPNVVGSAEVADNSLTGADIANNSLTGADIADNSLTGADIADNSLTAADIADGLGVSEIDEAQMQRRVTGSCPWGYSIASISQDGTVVCVDYDPRDMSSVDKVVGVGLTLTTTYTNSDGVVSGGPEWQNVPLGAAADQMNVMQNCPISLTKWQTRVQPTFLLTLYFSMNIIVNDP